MSGFCQFKTAFLLGQGFENLADHICEERIFSIVDDSLLPSGWELSETGISGAAGFLLIFDIERLPTQNDMDAVESYLKTLEAA